MAKTKDVDDSLSYGQAASSCTKHEESTQQLGEKNTANQLTSCWIVCLSLSQS